MRRRRIRPGAAGRKAGILIWKIFEELNARYFDGKLQRPHMAGAIEAAAAVRLLRSWSNHILLNRRMDRPSVPQFAVEYVLFHEMLHVKHPTRRFRLQPGVALPRISRGRKAFAEFARAGEYSTAWRVN